MNFEVINAGIEPFQIVPNDNCWTPPLWHNMDCPCGGLVHFCTDVNAGCTPSEDAS